MLKNIETYLHDEYIEATSSLLHQGKLQEVINIYKEVESFEYSEQHNNQVTYEKEKLIKKKNKLDDLIVYINSTDTLNFVNTINDLSYYFTTYSERPYKYYLKDRLGKGVYFSRTWDYLLELRDIFLDSRSLNDFELYLELTQFNNKYSSINNNRCVLFIEKYKKALSNQDLYNSRDNRIDLLKIIEPNNSELILPENDKHTMVENLSEYYKNKFKPNFSVIEDLYECYIINEILENRYDIPKHIRNYLKGRSYTLKKVRATGEVINKIFSELEQGKILNNSNINNGLNTINIELVQDTIYTEIESPTYSDTIDSKYLSGSHVEPNPQYNTNVDNVIYWEHEVARIRSANAACDNQPEAETFLGVIANLVCYQTLPIEKLNSARVKLANTPTTVEVNDYAPYEISKIGNSIYGEIKIMMKIVFNNEELFSDYLNSKIDIENHSLLGVHRDDINSYNETINLIPSDIILEDILFKKITKKIEEKLKDINWISSIMPIEIFNPADIEIQIPEFKSSEFMDLFSQKPASNEDDINYNSITLDDKEKAFKNLKEIITYAKNATCQILAYNSDFSAGSGTGYFISNQGYLITNHHVINNKENILLLREINNEIISKNAKVLYIDEKKDLALLKTNTIFNNSTIITVNPNLNVEMGDEILYVGYPGSPITDGSEPFTSRGIVSQVIKNSSKKPSLILFDITANPGSSGSAVIKENTGELIGTMTWGFGRSVTVEDIVDLLGGGAIRVKESQNVGTSNKMLISFLEESKYYAK